jgi:hypothetical protein
VAVPSLARLKAAAGQTVLSPDLELEHLLLAGALPPVPNCAGCGRAADRQVAVSVVCESATVDDGETPFWQKLLVGLLTGVHFLRLQSHRPGVYGRDVRFVLPVRLCEACDRETVGRERVRAALAHTPVYARLLAKYPHAAVARVG